MSGVQVSSVHASCICVTRVKAAAVTLKSSICTQDTSGVCSSPLGPVYSGSLPRGRPFFFHLTLLQEQRRTRESWISEFRLQKTQNTPLKDHSSASQKIYFQFENET